MKTKFIKFISVFLACTIFLSAFTGTIAFAYEDEIDAVVQSEPRNGWNEDRTQYFVDDVAVTGFYTIDNNKYYFDETTAIKVTGFQTINGKKYLFATTGEMLYGWQSYNNAKYYFDTTTGIAKTGLVKIGNAHYLFATDGKMKTGFQNYNNATYYFDAAADGKMVTGLKKIGTAYYYFASNGKRATGWKTINNVRYYFNTKSGKAYTGLKKIGSAYYYFASNGKCATGWKTVNGSRYFFDKKTNKAFTGLKKISSAYYYFNRYGQMQTGWKTINGSRYFFNKTNGKAYTGLKKIGSAYYYFNKYGKMQTGWKTIKGYKYYFNPAKGKNYGKAVTSSITIKGQTYRFDKNGRYISAASIMLKKANKLSSKTKYLVLVNKSTHRVGIFTGKKGNWKLTKYYACTIGAAATPTPTGTFTLGPSRGMPYHQLYFDSGHVRCWYASRIIGGYNFHSVLYTQASKPVSIVDPTLGANLSHGCIRLHIKNAKWFYDHVPSGTKCVIYNK